MIRSLFPRLRASINGIGSGLTNRFDAYHTHFGNRHLLRQELSLFHGIQLRENCMIHHNLDYDKVMMMEKAYGETKAAGVRDDVSGKVRNVETIHTGRFTGRSPNDKYFVKGTGESSGLIDWGKVNKPVTPEVFDKLYGKVVDYYSRRDRLYVFDGILGRALGGYKPKKVRVVTPYAWQHHFIKNMVVECDPEDKRPIDFTILNGGSDVVNAEFKEDGLGSEVFVAFNVERKVAVIGGTQYAGEMKKGLFTMMNYWMPLEGILPIHASASVTDATTGDTILISGLSGTGKTSWSSMPGLSLIGDDEHCWSDDGIFNIEGGCYAKTARLSARDEPLIFGAIRDRALVENVMIRDREIDFNDTSISENGRVSYPLDYVAGYEPSGIGKHPKRVVFLTCDAYGILPAVSRLTKEQANEWFLLGYTAKAPNTEIGVTEPTPTFSSCFGAAFLPLQAKVYGKLLMEKIEKHGASVYLVNTGYYGGSAAKGGKRMIMENTRKIMQSIVSGSIDKSDVIRTGMGLEVPTDVPGVDREYLMPWNMWKCQQEYAAEYVKFNQLIHDQLVKLGLRNA
jgi:phosphoenolpyruvate carboxykinase (ATP)